MDDYLKIVFKELYVSDGLVVMGQGLGIDRLFCKFLQHFSEKLENARKPLVLCLNVNNFEEPFYDLLIEEGIINNEITATERMEMYQVGGCYFVTSRILIVDMLDNRIDLKALGGLLIYNAHRIAEYSIDSFVIRLYRENNSNGFVKAFTDDAQSLTHSSHKLEKLLKTLHLKKLFLWPRFRLEIAQALENNNSIQPNVLELSMPLTNHMKIIQNSILVAMETCLQELKKSCPMLDNSHSHSSLSNTVNAAPQKEEEDATFSYFTLENSLFQNFDFILRNQLDADWHRLSFKTKQLITDITTLRQLLDYLIRYDAFSFYYLLTKIRATSSEQHSPSLWLTSEAGNQIFKHAKERLYTIETNPTKKEKSSWKRIAEHHPEIHKALQNLQLLSYLEPVLECPPKWKILLNLIEELQSTYQTERKQERVAQGVSTHPASANRILIIVRDELALSQLKDVLLHGTQYVMEQRFRWFISQQMNEIQRRSAAIKNKNTNCNSSSSQKMPSEERGKGTSGFIRVNAQQANRGSVLQNQKTSSSSSVKQAMESFEKELLQTIHGGEERDAEIANRGDEEDSEAVRILTEESSDLSSSTAGLAMDIDTLKGLPIELQLFAVQYRILQLLPSSKSKQERQRRPTAPACALPPAAGTQTSKKRPFSTISEHFSEPAAKTVDLSGEDEEERFKSYYFDPTTYHSNHRSRLLYEETGAENPLTTAEIEYSGQFLWEEEKEAERMTVQIVTHHQMRENLSLLPSLQPSILLLYDSDLLIVRKIETYQSRLVDQQLKVYLFNYEGSTEEHRYVGAIAKEKKSFESLIRAKEHLVISLPDNRQELLHEQQQDLLENRQDSRRSYLKDQQRLLDRKIVVDVREFRSSLPVLLYHHHFHLVPRTLTVGDYVLSPEIAVERKGITDLYQSFASGRLYHQMEQMAKYYQSPILLIEFAVEKSFCLVTPSEISSEIQVQSIISKLVLLIQSFPNLRILWSRSPQQTAEIFRLLMTNQDEVDIQKAMTVGNISSLSASLEETQLLLPAEGDGAGMTASSQREYYRYAAQEILLSLPGVNSQNYRQLMNHSKVQTLADISQLKESELTSLLGPINAKKLYAFFHHKR